MTLADENQVIPNIKCTNCGSENALGVEICSHCGKPINPIKLKRTGCLTAFLIIGLIWTSSELIWRLYRFDMYLKNYGEFFYYSLFTTVYNLLFFIGVWKWKKWVVEAYLTISLVLLFVLLVIGKNLPAVIISFIIDLGILFLLIHPNWKYFK